MTRTSLWTFTLLVAMALGVNLVLLSPKVAETAEEAVRTRLATASNAFRAQVDLADARLTPRVAAAAPDLIDALKPPADPTLPVPKPDEKALRAAAAAAQPVEPDLLIVATGDGAALSRRGKPAALVDDVKALPLVKAMLDGGAGGPAFVTFEGQLFRVQGAKISGSAGVVVIGQLYDDKLAALLRSMIDADISLIKDDAVVASSMPVAKRPALAAWSKNPTQGWGTLPLRLKLLGSSLDGKLPIGAPHYEARAVRQPLGSGVMAVLSVPVFAYFGWIGRYQAYYGIGFICFLIVALILALAPGPKAPEPKTVTVRQPVVPKSVEEAASRAAATLAGANDPEARPAAPEDVPWGSPPDHMPPMIRSHPELEVAGQGPVDLPDEGAHSQAAHAVAAAWGDQLSAPPAPAFALHPPVTPPRPPARPAGGDDAEPTIGKPATPAGSAALAGAGNEPKPKPADFSFAGLLDEAKGSAAAAAPSQQPSLSQDFPDRTNPGGPSPELLARSRDVAADPGVFPGDEPTRIEPVSAALLDKLREKDEPAADWAALETPNAPLPSVAAAGPAGAHHAWSALAPPSDNHAAAEARAAADAADQAELAAAEAAVAADEAAAAKLSAEMDAASAAEDAAAAQVAAEQAAAAAAAAAPANANVTLSDFSFTRPADADPDEAHFQETFQKFLDLRKQTGEAASQVSYDRFAAKLRKNREDLLAKHHAKGVRFSVYVKDGRAAIKAAAVR